MDGYLGRIMGNLPSTCHKDAAYFLQRHCFIDCRGPFSMHADAYFGIGVKVITTGHDISNWPELGRMIPKPVIVEEGAWVASWAVLHNCVIKAHAIVSIGAVVNGMVIPEYGVAVGNPARIVGYMYKGMVVPRDVWERFRAENNL